ncbi:MAG TPA: rRNA maturation RNase YbeY [Gemmatimonadales bacterium]|nr:rRNA maturation RNase YbeY [Gemmatimonadales bacterium]
MPRGVTDVGPVLVGGRVRPLPDRVVDHAVREVMRRERRQAAISVTFLGRDSMRRLHASHKGVDRPTDVLAFTLPAPDGTLLGDVYVCPWVAAREARHHRVPLRQELIRLVVHGTLHVLGWDHPDGEGRTASPMWRRQERYVAALA